jgi:hypothetical protein
MLIYFYLFIISIILEDSVQDIYLHNPRGSNNRLNEKSATRANNDRVFDSQVKILEKILKQNDY